MSEAGDADGPEELRYLLTPRAVRERCEQAYALAREGALDDWSLDLRRLPDVAARVVAVTRAAYPDVRAIPYHGRWRHLGVGGIDRVKQLDERLAGQARQAGHARHPGATADERLAAHVELVITSVLLDAGAGDRWSYRDAGGHTYRRSEGLAVASHDLFVSGALSSDPAGAPLRADAAGLAKITAADLARAFQVDDGNPLVGLEGRATVLQRLGAAIRDAPGYFGSPRLGSFAVTLRQASARARTDASRVHASLAAADLLGAVLAAFGPIWPGREFCAGVNLGDVWSHPQVGRVPFHKLSQWLTYSLCEPLEQGAVTVTGLGDLTGLAEYRNGGLFVDAGVLVPKDPTALAREHDVSSPFVVGWRALTVALLDRTAATVRTLLGLSADELPLARVLEGGTWRAGRELAAELRSGGGPPLRIRSDGTVF